MNRWIAVVAMLYVLAAPAFAIKVTLFMNIDTLIRRSHEIVIAKCVSVPTNATTGYEDGFYPARMELLENLKGDRKPGPFALGTIYPLVPGRTYLLCNSGGSAFGTDFLSVAELSVVQIPPFFALSRLADKPIGEQITMIFSARRSQIDRKMRELKQEL
jgi:hypothetical protein